MAPLTRRIAQMLATLIAALSTPCARAGWSEMGQVNANPPMLNEKFGCSVAIDGDWMAVGASDSTIGAARSTGAVHLFRNEGGTWNFKQSLSQDSPASFQAFGNAVALRGDTLAVGSWGASAFSGRVLVYRRDDAGTWNLVTTLAAGDPQRDRPALFGWSVSLDTPADGPAVLAIGRPNDGAQSTGAVYVFEREGDAWRQVNKLSLPDATPGDQAGTNVSVRDGTLVAGVARRRVAAVFRRIDGVWRHTATLRDTVFNGTDGFGSSVASGGKFVAVGAPSRAAGDAGVQRAGAVVVFRFDGTAWQQGASISLTSPRSGDNFGYAVTTCPSGPGGQPLIVASAPGFDVPATDAGVAFAFSLAGDLWKQQSTDLWRSKMGAGQFAGKSMGMSADGSMVALASELPRGSIGGAFPMKWVLGSVGSLADRGTTSGQTGGGASTSGGADAGGSTGTGTGGSTGTGTGTGSGSGSGSGTGSGSSGSGNQSGGSGSGGSGGGLGGDLSGGGIPSNPSDGFGQGGRPRAPQPLPALKADFGTVTDTVIVDAGALQSVIGLQTDGVQRKGKPELRVLATYPATWRLAATGDCNGDGSGDLVWEDDARNIRVWLRDGTKYLAQNTLRPLAATERVVASVDFDGDGMDDVITLDRATRQVHVLRMRNGTSAAEWTIDLPSLAWYVVPQRLDNGLLLRHGASGEVVHTTRDALTGAISSKPFPSPPPSAIIEGLGDFDGDGYPDMVTRDPESGELTIWRIDQRGRLVEARDTGIDGSRWRVEAVRDWDGNGVDDLLISEGGSGRLVVLSLHFEGKMTKILRSRVIGSTGGARVVDVTPR